MNATLTSHPMESTFCLLKRGATEIPDMFEGKTKNPLPAVCMKKLETGHEHLQTNYQRVREVPRSDFVKWLNEKARGGTLARLRDTDRKVWVLPLIENYGTILILSLDHMEEIEVPSPSIRLKVVRRSLRTNQGTPYIHFESLDHWCDTTIAAALDQFTDPIATVKFIYSMLESEEPPVIE